MKVIVRKEMGQPLEESCPRLPHARKTKKPGTSYMSERSEVQALRQVLFAVSEWADIHGLVFFTLDELMVKTSLTPEFLVAALKELEEAGNIELLSHSLTGADTSKTRVYKLNARWVA